MPITSKPLPKDVLTKYIELKKDKHDAYTELLSHIVYMEQREATLVQIVELFMLLAEKLSADIELKARIEDARKKLKDGGFKN